MKKICSSLVLIALVIGLSGSVTAKSEYLPEEYITYTEEIGAKYHISPEFIQAVIETESGGDPGAYNGICCGLMQIYPKYHYDRMSKLGVTDIYDPYSNILVGTDILAELFQKYEDPYLVLMCYNQGEGSARRMYNNGTYSNYAVSICQRSADLEKNHGK